MKTKIHPVYYPEVQVTCACGNSFVTGSTKQLIKVDICSNCHPFYTGELKFVDTQGRVEKFQQKQKQAGKEFISKKARRQALKQATDKTSEPKTLKDMLQAPVSSSAKVNPKQSHKQTKH